jgi:hypothetical protein
MSGDDHSRLRGALAELAEHGGQPDLYDRVVRTSRRLRRRAALTVAGAAASVAVAIGAGVAASPGGPLPVAPAPPPAISPQPAMRPEVIPTAPSYGATPGATLPEPPKKPLEQGG